MFDSSIKLVIDSKLNQVPPLGKAVRGIASSVIDDELELYQIELCLVEAVTNVINHAYHRNPGNEVIVKVALTESQIIIQIIDSGDKSSRVIPKEELNYNPSDVTSLPESGMGLFIIYKIMDEVSYLDNEEKNVLLMRKSFKKR